MWRQRWVALGLLVVLALANVLTPGDARGADDPSNIPGVPLPGPVATGVLGGPVYDVVYRLSVPPGNVIVASLTGSPGTDFDLYLFDATATTVYGTAGLVASSLGPTSTEAISYPSAAGGTYYLDLNGATDVFGSYTLVVQIVPDRTPPQVSIQLDDGRPATNDPQVTVSLHAWDDLSGVSAMTFSNDGVSWGPWVPFTPTASWTIPAGDGPHTVWAKVMNGVGLESEPAQATIVLDTVPPGVVAITPAPGSWVAGLQPVLAVSFDEPLDPASWLQMGLLVQAADGTLIPGRYAYLADSRTGTFVPSQPLVAGETYVVGLGPVRDLAGNRVAPVGSWTIRPLIPTTVTLTASPRVLVAGEASRLALALAGGPTNGPLALTAEPAGGEAVAQQVNLTDGRASLVVRPAVNTTYQAAYPGTDRLAPSSATVRVLVRRAVTLEGVLAGGLQVGRRGSPVDLRAVVAPRAPEVVVTFWIYRNLGAGRGFGLVAAVRRTTVGGRAVWTWRPTVAGEYRVRVTTPPTVLFANGVSPWYRWLIR